MDTGRAGSDPPEPQWWQALPPADATIRCGEGQHVIRWADGTLTLPAHPDAEAELVLGALGGDSVECVELAAIWGRHCDDLDVLALGPRSAGDGLTRIGRDDLALAGRAPSPGMASPPGLPASPGPAGNVGVWPPQPPLQQHQQRLMSAITGIAGPAPPASPPAASAVFATPPQPVEPDPDGRRASRIELLSLFALGPAFQLRLAGAVAAGQARAGVSPAKRPRMTAALTGRLALAAEEWLGIDPDRVSATVYEGTGWGSLELTGTGNDRSLRASLPLTWLAEVWACGLAVAGGHLVIAVRAAQWPDAEVLALPAPGAEPTVLRLHGSPPAGDPGASPRWAGPEATP